MGLLTDEQLQEFLSVDCGKGFGSDENNGYVSHKLYSIYREDVDEIKFFDYYYDLD